MKDLNPKQLTIAQAKQIHILNKDVLAAEAETEKLSAKLKSLKIRFEETTRSLACFKKELASTVRPSVVQTKKLVALVTECENLKDEIDNVECAHDESSKKSVAKRNFLNALLKKHGLVQVQQPKAPITFHTAPKGFSSNAGADWAEQCNEDEKSDAAMGNNVNYAAV